MAEENKNTDALDSAKRFSRPTTFDPGALTRSYRAVKDRQRAEKVQDRQLEIQEERVKMERERLSLQEQAQLMRMKELEAQEREREFNRQLKYEEAYGRKPPSFEPTEFGQINKAAVRVGEKLTDVRNNIFEQMSTGSLSHSEGRKKIRDIDRQLDQVDASYKAFKSLSDEYLEMVEDPNKRISGLMDTEFPGLVERLQKGMWDVELDNNKPHFVMFNEDGSFHSSLEFDELINKDVRLIEHFDVVDSMQSLVSKLGTGAYADETVSSSGLSADAKSALDAELDRMVKDDNVVADVLFQMGLNEDRLKGFTAEERALVRSELLEAAQGAVDTTFQRRTAADDQPTEEIMDPVNPVIIPDEKGEGVVEVGFFNGEESAGAGYVFSVQGAPEFEGANIKSFIYDPRTQRVQAVGSKMVDQEKQVGVTSKRTKVKSKEPVDVFISDAAELQKIISGMTDPRLSTPTKKVNFTSVLEFKNYMHQRLFGDQGKTGRYDNIANE